RLSLSCPHRLVRALRRASVRCARQGHLRGLQRRYRLGRHGPCIPVGRRRSRGLAGQPVRRCAQRLSRRETCRSQDHSGHARRNQCRSGVIRLPGRIPWQGAAAAFRADPGPPRRTLHQVPHHLSGGDRRSGRRGLQQVSAPLRLALRRPTAAHATGSSRWPGFAKMDCMVAVFRSALRAAAAACMAALLAGAVNSAESTDAPAAQEAGQETPETDTPEAGPGSAAAPDSEAAGEPEVPDPPPAGAPEQRITEEGELISTEEVEEPDLAELPLSNAARVRLDAARESVVLVRGFFGDAASSAFHGTGFAVGDQGFIVTNYHVVSEAVLHPRRFRLEYLTSDGRRGRLRVHAVDVRNDLAVLKPQEDLALPPLRVRTDIPRPGARAYSIGFPLNLGLTITEGVANGVVASGFEQRIHYTGAINSGMSGGP